MFRPVPQPEARNGMRLIHTDRDLLVALQLAWRDLKLGAR